MTSLRDWLKANKLVGVADALEAADIDLDILPDLSEADLAELGLSLGNRRRLLKAVAEVGTAPSPAPTATEATTEAERRQVTVMFCDLVGSTALSSTTDPEHLGDLIRRYQNAVAGAIGRYGGFVAKFMGDGVLAYFGFPQAFEDAAERAVRAALAIVAEVGGMTRPDGAKLQTRIGIATGLVVVGELIGSGPAQERTIVGETPNLAARLQALAALDTIMVADSTRQLLGGRFELVLSGPHEIKGLPAPVTAWRIVGEAAVESRFAAARHAELPLLGRDHEMALLRERWRLAKADEGQIVTMIGEAGIGKSRLIEALQEQLGVDPRVRIHLQCSPYHTDSALYPMIQGLARSARFAPEDSAATKVAKLAAIFPARAMPLIAELMSLPGEPSPLPPPQRKDATIRLLIDRILHYSESDPVLLVLEDAHWIDATTLELMTLLVDSIGSARVLVLVTARPDFVPPWQTRPHATLLTLGRLARADCARLVADVAAEHGLTAETVAAIVSKTDGVPLFVEELTRSVMEQAGDGGAAVPATLQDSLMARLDRLGPARETAQIAAVIGRDFSFALLCAAADKGDAELETALARLVAAGIVFPQGRNQDRGYSFKHALMRDAAYESLLLSRRRDWHTRIARALEAHLPDIVANEPEVLAQHFAAAGLNAEACDYRAKAGDRAVSRSAYREAIAHYNAGIAAAEMLSDDEARRRQLALLLKLGPAYTIIAGAQSADCARVYGRAAEIGAALGDNHATYRAKWGLWLNANLGRKTARARDRAAELITLARQSADAELLLEGYHCGWSTALFRGDLATIFEWARFGTETYDVARHRHLGPAFGGHDPGVCAFACNAMAYMLTGERELATANAARSVVLGETLDHPFSLAHGFYNAAAAYQLGGDRAATGEWSERTVALAEKYDFRSYLAGARLMRAWAAATTSNAETAVAFIESSIEQTVAVGPTAQQFLGIAGEMMMIGGRYREALALLDRGVDANEERDVGPYIAEIHRLRGLCLLALDRVNEAEARAAFAQARTIAHRQGALVFEQRAVTTLAELSGV